MSTHQLDDMPSITHKFDISGHEGYIIVGLDKGQPWDVFIRMSKQGSTLSGMMNTIAILTSTALQNGIPLTTIVDPLIDVQFEPQGHTTNSDIPIAKSIVDYIYRWLQSRFEY